MRSPDPRWTSCVGIVTVRGGPSSPSSRANASAAPCSPSFHGSARTTVVPSRSASSKSSKPASATGFGAPASACSAPIVLRLLAVKRAVGLSGISQQPLDGGPGGGDVAVAGLQQRRVLRRGRRRRAPRGSRRCARAPCTARRRRRRRRSACGPGRSGARPRCGRRRGRRAARCRPRCRAAGGRGRRAREDDAR